MPEDKTQYIILPENKNYSALDVAVHRLGFDNETKESARRLRLKLKNTTRELNGHSYLAFMNNNRGDPLKLVLSLEDSLVLDIKRVLGLRQLLIDGITGSEKVRYSNGETIHDVNILKLMYDEMFGIRKPSRGEHLADAFIKIGDIFYQATEPYLIGDRLVYKKIEPLEKCLMGASYIDIKSLNHQGLPTRKAIEKDLFYCPPGNHSVAGLFVGADMAGLSCGRVAKSSIPHYVGVRRAKVRKS